MVIIYLVFLFIKNTFIAVAEVCQSESFDASCEANHVILIGSAHYGRMRKGRCIRGLYGGMNCFVDVTSYLDERCSGRQSCSVYGADAQLATLNQCPSDLMPYLEVVHTCVQGQLAVPTNT